MQFDPQHDRQRTTRSSLIARKTNQDAAPSDLSYIAEPLRSFAVPIDSVVLDPKNARKHGEENLKAIDNAMAERGYLQEYRRGPSYFIVLRLPRRVKRHIAENKSRRVEIIRAVLNEHDRAHWDAIRKIYGAARHDIELRNSAHLRKPKGPLVCA